MSHRAIINGKDHEQSTDISTLLDSNLTDHRFGKGVKEYYTRFRIKRNRYKIFKHHGLKKYMQLSGHYQSGYRDIHPDEAILNETEKTIIVVEKKYQETSGSTDEKIGLGEIKRFNLCMMYPGWRIVYVYLLNSWFDGPKYDLEREYYRYNDHVHLLFDYQPDLGLKIKELLLENGIRY